MPVKTLEFKLKLTKNQKSSRDFWLNSLRWVWNSGLELLENFYQFHAWDPTSKVWVPCSPIPWEYRRDGQENIPYCWLGRTTSCPIPQPYRPSPLSGNPGPKPYFWLRPFFAQKNHPNKPWFQKIPSIFVSDILERLSKAWIQYRKGDKGKPRYRTKKTQNTTLETSQVKTRVHIEGRHIKIPGFGRLRVKGLDTRLPKDARLKFCRICKFASGDYLQLGIEVHEKILPESDLICGIDVGIEYLYATDHGRLVKSPRYFQQSEKKLARLQRHLGRPKTKKHPKEVDSKNHGKLKKKIAKLHERIARQRRAFNHWHSSNLVEIYGGIAIEDVDLSTLVRKKTSKKELRDLDKSHAKSGFRSRYNKALMDVGCGQFLLFLSRKSQHSSREFQRVDSAYTSQDCPACGYRNQLDLKKRIFCCEKCGYKIQRKHAAAKVIRQRADFERSYRGCHRDVRPVEPPQEEALKQESQLAKVGTANADGQVDRSANHSDSQTMLR